MKKNEKWIVALDVSPMDSDILRYTRSLSEVLHPKEIVFVNVMEEDHSSAYISNELMDYQMVMAEEKRLVLRSKIDSVFGGQKVPYEVHLLEGDPFSEIADLAERRNSDLIIAGNKHQTSGSGVLSDRLSKILETNFLLVPEAFSAKFENVLVSSDFSEYSGLALYQAIQLRNELEDLNIHVFNSFEVPVEYSKDQDNYEVFKNIVESNTEKIMDQWLKDFEHTGVPVLTTSEDKTVTQQLLDAAVDKDTDLIIIGSRGRRGESKLYSESHTWSLVQQSSEIPIMIVKKSL